jgi:hypothetical protein
MPYDHGPYWSKRMGRCDAGLGGAREMVESRGHPALRDVCAGGRHVPLYGLCETGEALVEGMVDDTTGKSLTMRAIPVARNEEKGP